MKKYCLLFLLCFATCKAFADPTVIYTSCGVHMTDTDLWDGMTYEEIKRELEKICTEDQEAIP